MRTHFAAGDHRLHARILCGQECAELLLDSMRKASFIGLQFSRMVMLGVVCVHENDVAPSVPRLGQALAHVFAVEDGSVLATAGRFF